MTTITFSGNVSAVNRVAVDRSRDSAPRLRLTRRGRAVFTTLAAAPLVAIAVFLGLGGGDAVAGSSLSGTDVSAESFDYVSIAPGQSLWQLAEQVAPQADPREVVADILALNGLQSADVQPGQELAIPLQYTE